MTTGSLVPISLTWLRGWMYYFFERRLQSSTHPQHTGALGFTLFGTNTHVLYKEWLEDSFELHILGRGRNRVLLQGLEA